MYPEIICHVTSLFLLLLLANIDILLIPMQLSSVASWWTEALLHCLACWYTG